MKRPLLGIGLSVAALLILRRQGTMPQAGRPLPSPHWRSGAPSAVDRLPIADRRDVRDEALPAEVARRVLVYAIPPIWISAGLADWLCHRVARIETNAGPKESLIHLLMSAEVGVPTLACMFLEITPPVVALSLGSFVVHQATALWDLEYAVQHREISPIEQQVHSFLELTPLMAIAFIACLRWDEFVALLRTDRDRAEFTLKLRDPPLPGNYVLLLLGAICLFNGLPYLEELWRCTRASAARAIPFSTD